MLVQSALVLHVDPMPHAGHVAPPQSTPVSAPFLMPSEQVAAAPTQRPAPSQVVPPFCDNGAGCVYARYLANGSGPELSAAGISDVDGFTGFYWSQQLSGAGTILVLTLAGALGGGFVYGALRPKPSSSRSVTADGQAGGGT